MRLERSSNLIPLPVVSDMPKEEPTFSPGDLFQIEDYGIYMLICETCDRVALLNILRGFTRTTSVDVANKNKVTSETIRKLAINSVRHIGRFESK